MLITTLLITQTLLLSLFLILEIRKLFPKNIQTNQKNTSSKLLESIQLDVHQKTQQIQSLEADLHQKNSLIQLAQSDVHQKTQQIQSLEADLHQKNSLIQLAQSDVHQKTQQIQTLEAKMGEFQSYYPLNEIENLFQELNHLPEITQKIFARYQKIDHALIFLKIIISLSFSQESILSVINVTNIRQFSNDSFALSFLDKVTDLLISLHNHQVASDQKQLLRMSDKKEYEDHEIFSLKNANQPLKMIFRGIKDSKEAIILKNIVEF
jgi:hypothetical protein